MLRVAECQPDLGSICVFHTPIRSSAAPGAWRGCDTRRDLPVSAENRQLVVYGTGLGTDSSSLGESPAKTQSPANGLGRGRGEKPASWWLRTLGAVENRPVGGSLVAWHRGFLSGCSHPAEASRGPDPNIVGIAAHRPSHISRNHVIQSTR